MVSTSTELNSKAPILDIPAMSDVNEGLKAAITHVCPLLLICNGIGEMLSVLDYACSEFAPGLSQIGCFRQLGCQILATSSSEHPEWPQNWSKRHPKGTLEAPNAATRTPKGQPKCSKRSPGYLSLWGAAKVTSKGSPKGSQKGPPNGPCGPKNELPEHSGGLD